MEVTEVPKRKYRKHKKGFKIAVEHKLYVKGKEAEYEPLYIEIRAKNQNTLIKSRFNCCINPIDFDKLFENEIIAECLLIEKNSIIESVKREVYEYGIDFSMKDWYKKYAKSSDRKYLADIYYEYVKVLFLEAAHEKSVDELLVIHAMGQNEGEFSNNIITSMRLLNAFGVQNFKDPIELVNKIFEFQRPAVSFDIHQQIFRGIGYFHITESIVNSDLNNGLFSKICKQYIDNQEDNFKFKKNAAAIERMLIKINEKK